MFIIKNTFQKTFEPIVQAENINVAQALILFNIDNKHMINIKQLTQDLEINQGNTSLMCKNLEKLGLIERTRNPEDERMVTLTLTCQGKKIKDNIERKLKEIDDYFIGIPKEKFDKIIDGIETLGEVLQTSKQEQNI